ncbi:SusE domain-containing protein [Sphingobacterium gobiense]|uniref:Uncharacterized protein n=1 Tax=Sphingobacterium gobiense TaxID=1382456 RepID=A0A2S9JD52_9SPHI|nr:SusF/SusE family outer membrane protein [Sphingobacterium gobiense]PRD50806.1 hypothetical protein C5749_19140 [Sphingobacterium gobiense]
MMKSLLTILLAVFCLIGCRDEAVSPEIEDLIGEYREDDAIRLEVSSRFIELDPLKRRDQALLVTWEPLTDIEQQYSVKYLFKIYLTENGFPTSVVSEVLPEGMNYKVFTHQELENLIRRVWGRQDNQDVSVSIRVIAQIISEEKFIKPLYATQEFVVRPFNLEPAPMFMYGDVFGTGGISNMIALEEYSAGEIYIWRGKLLQGTFKIAQKLGEEYPAYVKGEGDHMELIEAPNADTKGFTIPHDGNYRILVDRLNEKISMEEVPHLELYFGGSATPTAFNQPPKPLVWDVYKPHIGTITTDLSAGECKFSTELNFSGGTLQLRPRKPDASIVSDIDIIASNNNPDWKWRVQANQAGTYRITLDVKSMKVQFLKLN